MPENKQNKALVLFSGGQDSTIALFWALERFEHVETIGFSYGQRHDVEMACRQQVIKTLRAKFPKNAERLGDDHLLELSTLGQLSDSALTRDAEIVLLDSGLPNTFVPGRNLLFFTYAAALGYRRSIDTLIGGMCETDFSGYPDCRNETLQSLANTISLGMDREIAIKTPLMFIDKAQSWQLAEDLGGDKLVHIIIEHSHTCYKGERDTRHDWGYGCAACPACELRAAGYRKWRRAGSKTRQ